MTESEFHYACREGQEIIHTHCDQRLSRIQMGLGLEGTTLICTTCHTSWSAFKALAKSPEWREARFRLAPPKETGTHRLVDEVVGKNLVTKLVPL